MITIKNTTDWLSTRFAQANVFTDYAARWARSHALDVERWRNSTKWNPAYLQDASEDAKLASLGHSMSFSARCAWGAALVAEAIRVLKHHDLTYLVPLAAVHVAGKGTMQSLERMMRGHLRSEFRRFLRRAVKLGHVEVYGKEKGLNVYTLTEAGEKNMRFWLQHAEDNRDALQAIVQDMAHDAAIEEYEATAGYYGNDSIGAGPSKLQAVEDAVEAEGGEVIAHFNAQLETAHEEARRHESSRNFGGEPQANDTHSNAVEVSITELPAYVAALTREGVVYTTTRTANGTFLVEVTGY
jgi:hypothetical protein